MATAEVTAEVTAEITMGQYDKTCDKTQGSINSRAKVIRTLS